MKIEHHVLGMFLLNCYFAMVILFLGTVLYDLFINYSVLLNHYREGQVTQAEYEQEHNTTVALLLMLNVVAHMLTALHRIFALNRSIGEWVENDPLCKRTA